jgi:hypothetical protein
MDLLLLPVVGLTAGRKTGRKMRGYVFVSQGLTWEVLDEDIQAKRARPLELDTCR